MDSISDDYYIFEIDLCVCYEIQKYEFMNGKQNASSEIPIMLNQLMADLRHISHLVFVFEWHSLLNLTQFQHFHSMFY